VCCNYAAADLIDNIKSIFLLLLSLNVRYISGRSCELHCWLIESLESFNVVSSMVTVVCATKELEYYYDWIIKLNTG
jgi:hypothetical protein